jgi:hypothetical protein
MNSAEAYAALTRAIADLCDDVNSGSFSPLLEADIAAHLYHRLLTNGCPPGVVHLATRICGELERTRKPDLVLGDLVTQQACIRPALICELKVFPRRGFTDQQMQHRFDGIRTNDIPTLDEMSPVLSAGRVEIIADFFVSRDRMGYLTGTWNGKRRIDVVAGECKRIGAHLLWLRPVAGDRVACQAVVEEPVITA